MMRARNPPQNNDQQLVNTMPYDTCSPTLLHVFRRHAQQRAEEIAYIFLDSNGEESASICYGELYGRSCRMAQRLLRHGAPGDTVLLMHGPGLEFIEDFLGILLAGMIAVPVMLPRANEGVERVAMIAANATIASVLTSRETLERISRFDTAFCKTLLSKWVTAEASEGGRDEPTLDPNDSRPAFLQYTSGSTGTPKGVVISHGNLLNNQRVIAESFGHDDRTTVVVGWLPLYHDMGLIGNVLQPLFLGRPCILMSPMSFLMRPIIWLRAIAKYRATTSGGPNFSYDLCVQKVSPAEAASLDLSWWKLAFNGAEPVRAQTLITFARHFAASGFSIKSFYPCYGLAECTLFVSGGDRSGPRALQDGVARPLEASPTSASQVFDFSHYVASGHSRHGNSVRIVDPDTQRLCAAGEIGEIWVHGPSVAQGYWGQKSLSDSVFGCTLADEPELRFFRTGDLGFQDGTGELFVVGRLKDMIIIRGVNYFAEDIEAVAESAHPLVNHAASAAFSVDSSSGEQLIVLLEAPRRGMAADERELAADAVRDKIAQRFGITPAAVSFTRYGTLPVTTSGKIKRRQCRDDFMHERVQLLA